MLFTFYAANIVLFDLFIFQFLLQDGICNHDHETEYMRIQ